MFPAAKVQSQCVKTTSIKAKNKNYIMHAQIKNQIENPNKK